MRISLPPHCPMQGGKCALEKSVAKQRMSQKPYVFLALPSSEIFNDTEATMKAIVEGGHVFKQKYVPKKIEGRKVSALLAREERFVGQGICKICQLCWFCDFGIVEVGSLNPNVMIEVGLLMGFAKKIVYTLHVAHTSIESIPFDLGNPMLVAYGSAIRLASDLDDKVNFIILTMARS